MYILILLIINSINTFSYSVFLIGLRNVGDKSNSGREDSVNSVKWEYKMSNDGDAEIIGPKTSAEMLDLQNEGKFVDGGWARKLGTQSFYSIARLDFEIYI